MKPEKHLLATLLAFIIGILVIALMLVWITSIFDAKACLDLSDTTGYQTKYSATNGCFININGEFIPESTWRK